MNVSFKQAEVTLQKKKYAKITEDWKANKKKDLFLYGYMQRKALFAAKAPLRCFHRDIIYAVITSKTLHHNGQQHRRKYIMLATGRRQCYPAPHFIIFDGHPSAMNGTVMLSWQSRFLLTLELNIAIAEIGKLSPTEQNVMDP